MNIFATNYCPIQAAIDSCDKLCVKMIVESSQLLATCFSLNRLAEKDCPRTKTGNPRKWFNPKHPSSIWTRESTGNLDWLILHTQAMLEEKYRRYPDKGRHFCHDFLDWVIDNLDDSFVPKGKQTDFSIAISESMSCRTHPLFENGSAVDKYRLYYTHDKHFAKWDRAVKEPDWFKDEKYKVID